MVLRIFKQISIPSVIVKSLQMHPHGPTDAIIAHTETLINKNWTITQFGTPSMSDLEYTINTSGTFTLKVRIGSNYTVDWGDGSSLETSTSSTLSHTYSSSGTYVVKININSGARYGPNYNNNADGDEIISVAVSSFTASIPTTSIQTRL